MKFIVSVSTLVTFIMAVSSVAEELRQGDQAGEAGDVEQLPEQTQPPGFAGEIPIQTQPPGFAEQRPMPRQPIGFPWQQPIQTRELSTADVENFLDLKIYQFARAYPKLANEILGMLKMYITLNRNRVKSFAQKAKFYMANNPGSVENILSHMTDHFLNTL